MSGKVGGKCRRYVEANVIQLLVLVGCEMFVINTRRLWLGYLAPGRRVSIW